MKRPRAPTVVMSPLRAARQRCIEQRIRDPRCDCVAADSRTPKSSIDERNLRSTALAVQPSPNADRAESPWIPATMPTTASRMSYRHVPRTGTATEPNRDSHGRRLPGLAGRGTNRARNEPASDNGQQASGYAATRRVVRRKETPKHRACGSGCLRAPHVLHCRT